MPRRQKKGTDSACNNDALTLLRLQQVVQLTTAKTALEDIQKLVHETALYNFTSAQDRRTLNTAQCYLNSLRIRVEAHVNTVEETVKQRQLSLSLHQRKETAEAPVVPEKTPTKSKRCLLLFWHRDGWPLRTVYWSCFSDLLWLIFSRSPTSNQYPFFPTSTDAHSTHPCGKFKPKLVQKSFLRKSQDLHLDANPTTYAKAKFTQTRFPHTSSQVRNSSTLLDALSEVL